MSYDSALLTTIAQVVAITGTVDLANLQADSELAVSDLLLEAHRSIYRRLEAAGIDPTALSNQARLTAAVAYEALSRLALAGLLSGGASRTELVALYRDQVDREVASFRPELSTGDEPTSAESGAPSFGNFEPGWAYGPSSGASKTGQRYWEDVPADPR